MTFGEAIEAAKRGERIQRAGWNGKHMWVAYTPGSTIPIGAARAGAASHLASELSALAQDIHEAESMTMRINPHFDMRASDGSLVVGWLASQTDIAADDWSVVTSFAPYVTGGPTPVSLPA